MRPEVSFKSQIVEDIGLNGEPESYICLTQITTRTFPNGQSEVISEHEYPRVRIFTKFKDMWNREVLYNLNNRNHIMYRIQEVVTTQLEKAQAELNIMVEKEFKIDENIYSIIYVPTRHWGYSSHVRGIIKELSQTCNVDNFMIILPDSHKETYDTIEMEDAEFPGISIKYFDPESFTEYIYATVIP